jgi:ferredoxin
MSYLQVNENCNGCLACVQNCPANALQAIDQAETRTLQHNMARCARCGNCWRICPQDAIEFQHLLKNKWDNVVELTLDHCRVCGEALYSKDYARDLSAKLRKTIQPLCTRHREAREALAQTHFPNAMLLVKGDEPQ